MWFSEFAFRNPYRSDSDAARVDLGRLIGALHRAELPVEELAVEFLTGELVVLSLRIT